MILQSLQFILCCVQKMILYQFVGGQNFKNTVSFDDIVHSTVEENIVTYVDFDGGITFYPETPTKNQTDQPRTELHFQIRWKFQVHSQQRSTYYFVDEQHSFKVFLKPYNLWDRVPAALKSINHTNDIYSMS